MPTRSLPRALPATQPPFTLGFWAVATYLVVFIVRPWELLIPELMAVRFERIVVALMLLAVIREGVSLRGQSKSVLAFCGALIVSMLVAKKQGIAWDAGYAVLPQFVLFFAVLCVVRRQRDLNLMILVFLAALTMYVGKSQWEFWINNLHKTAQGVQRLIGVNRTEGDPNAIAMHVVVSLPLLVYCFRNRKTIRGQLPPALQWIVIPGLCAYGVLAVMTVFQSHSRAGLLGLGVFCFLTSFSVLRHGKVIRALLLFMVLIAGFWILLPDSVRGRLETLWDPNAGPQNARTSAEGRIEGFYAGMQMLGRHPVSGVGLGNFMFYRQAHGDGKAVMAHNLPGQVLGEFGLVGGFAFALMVIVAYGSTRRTRREARRFARNPLMKQHDHLATACRNMILLMLFFGLALHNALKYDWLWIFAFAGLNLEFSKQTARRMGQIGRRPGIDGAAASQRDHMQAHDVGGNRNLPR